MRFASGALLLVLLVIGARFALDALRSPEEVVRDRLDEAARGFDATRLSPCMELFAEGFADETSGFRRNDVRDALVHAFFREVDPKTRAFRYRVRVEDVAVAVADDEHGAEASFTVRLEERAPGPDAWREAWTYRVEGTFSGGADGWRLARSRWTTSAGAIPKH